MSRTYKDKPYKFRDPENDHDYRYEYFEYESEGLDWKGNPYSGIRRFYVERAGVLTKKKKRVDTEYHWMSTPSWWTRLFMNRPQRIASKRWERDVVRMSFWDIAQDSFDPPPMGKKPHVYFW
jgi:hypothetical protein